jgi:hypothetical protein
MSGDGKGEVETKLLGGVGGGLERSEGEAAGLGDLTRGGTGAVEGVEVVGFTFVYLPFESRGGGGFLAGFMQGAG